MDVFRPKPWLTPAQQVLHLESEGIKFELASKQEAACYLEANNNFFRINLFRKGFPKYEGGLNDGLYINLDFGMLRDLAIIDYEFRQVLLSVSIDVEHFSKIQLLRYLERRQEDGYSVVGDYISINDRSLESGKIVNSVKSEIDRGANGCYTKQIIDDLQGGDPLTRLVETLKTLYVLSDFRIRLFQLS